MRVRHLLLAALLLVPLDARGQTGSVASLDWLIGCWERTMQTGRGYEEWRRGSEGELLGSAWIITASGDRLTERLRIHKVRDTLVYEAHPATQSLTLFPLRSAGDQSAVFENLAHDFPKRISYRRSGEDSLVAIVADTASNTRPLTFAFRRASECPAPGR